VFVKLWKLYIICVLDMRSILFDRFHRKCVAGVCFNRDDARSATGNKCVLRCGEVVVHKSDKIYVVYGFDKIYVVYGLTRSLSIL
jgi:hypothetical protein